ncbi:hypothetical protein F2Q68_00037483 [Brassica cretica]|uniref:Uncharacterized protein n=1 Tax=Brassica cretica TaxID=69181 RepID=A0A8S9H100_BRACR|nr:hypothetical protein F2Q68_00037483 [Brassica cretica]
MLRSLSVTNYWTQHGNFELRGLDPIKSSSLSSNFILRASLETKLELEIHLVSLVSLVEVKADCACFRFILSQIGHRTLNAAYGSGAPRLKLLPVNIPTSSYSFRETVAPSALISPALVSGVTFSFWWSAGFWLRRYISSSDVSVGSWLHVSLLFAVVTLVFFGMYGDLTLKTKVLYIVTFSSPDVVDGEAL